MAIERSILIFGGSGMLGHVLWKKAMARYNAFVALRKIPPGHEGLFPAERTIVGLDVRDSEAVRETLNRYRPDCVVNCVGIVKQSPIIQDPASVIQINSLFPHQLAAICSDLGIRLIHLSTDCVFSGEKGHYSEEDFPGPIDLYGRSKLLGEPSGSNILTLRTSMIGFELETRHGLLEWFLAQEGGVVRGFKRALFNGLYTEELAGIILELIDNWPGLAGVRHIGGEVISKYDLLSLIRAECNLDILIEPDESFVCDRSLDASKIQKETGIKIPSWSEMVHSLAIDLKKRRKK